MKYRLERFDKNGKLMSVDIKDTMEQINEKYKSYPYEESLFRLYKCDNRDNNYFRREIPLINRRLT